MQPSLCFLMSCYCFVFKSRMDIDVVIVFFLKPIVWLYIKCCTSRRNGTSMAHKGIKSKCCQGHLQGMKLWKIRILSSMHPCPTSGSDHNH
jgi:hypothetical protein